MRLGGLLSALLPFASVFALGCNGGALNTPDAAAASGNGAHPVTGGMAASSDAGEASATDAGSGTSGDALDEASGDDAANDGAMTPISWDGRAPLEHRASATECPRGRSADLGFVCPDSGALPLPGNPCDADSDCAGGANGMCLCAPDLVPPPSGSGPGILYTETFCSYDQCFVDSDCGRRVPCDCRDPNIAGGPNVCLSASNCAVDSDCGPPWLCSPSLVSGQEPDFGFFCHTPNDTCLDDSDCPAPGGPILAECSFDATSAIWRCFQFPSRP